MDSIAKATGKWQRIEQKPIEVYNRGLRIPKTGFAFVPSNLQNEDRKQRGKITTFSTHARQRLRRALLTESIPSASRFGITLTLPWKGSNFEPLMDEFRECWNRFGVSFRRAFPHSAIIYRVELQQRGAPHIHALAYITDEDAFVGFGDAPVASPVADAARLCSVQMQVWDLWSKSVPDLHHGGLDAFMKRGVRVDSLKSDGAIMRYICDHTSKHKQAQLGYKGKQWGRLGGSNLRHERPVVLDDFESDRHAVLFFRMLRKVMRYRVTDYKRPRKWKRRPPFGSIIRGSRRTVGEFYISADTVLKMYDFARCQSSAS